jgi:hypothetical protein
MASKAGGRRSAQVKTPRDYAGRHRMGQISGDAVSLTRAAVSSPSLEKGRVQKSGSQSINKSNIGIE